MGNATVDNIMNKFSEGVFAVDPLERVHIDEKLGKHIKEKDPRFDRFYQGASSREIAEIEQVSAESKRKIVEAYAMSLAHSDGAIFRETLREKLVNRGNRTRTEIVDSIHEEERGVYEFNRSKRTPAFYSRCLGLNLW